MRSICQKISAHMCRSPRVRRGEGISRRIPLLWALHSAWTRETTRGMTVTGKMIAHIPVQAPIHWYHRTSAKRKERRTDTPTPGTVCQDSRSHIATDPCVDEERGSRNIAEEQSGTKRGNICDQDFDEQLRTGVTKLVED